MDEIESRIVAHELALIEVAAYLERTNLGEAIRSILAGLVVGIIEEGRVSRIAASELIEDAIRRHEPQLARLFLKR